MLDSLFSYTTLISVIDGRARDSGANVRLKQHARTGRKNWPPLPRSIEPSPGSRVAFSSIDLACTTRFNFQLPQVESWSRTADTHEGDGVYTLSRGKVFGFVLKHTHEKIRSRRLILRDVCKHMNERFFHQARGSMIGASDIVTERTNTAAKKTSV